MPWLNRLDVGLARRRGCPLRPRLRPRGPRAGGRPRRWAPGRAPGPCRDCLRRRRVARVRDARRGAPVPRPRRRIARSPDRGARRPPSQQSQLARRSMTRRTWVVLPDQLSIRVFFDTGIVERAPGAARRVPGRRLSGPRRGSGGLGPAAARPPRVRRGAHGARWAPRPSAGADRRALDRTARLPPARDPSELPARLPCRANAGRAPELDARHRPRRPTATLAGCRPRHGAVVLQRATACPVGGFSRPCGGIVPASCSRTCSPRARCRSSRLRVACGYRWLRTWPAGTTRSARA